ncbi:hypothetical protein ACC741_38260, partial [Rhizobium johnstonii]
MNGCDQRLFIDGRPSGDVDQDAKDLRIEEREPEVAGAGQVEIDIEAGGICGSDLHYYNHGG